MIDRLEKVGAERACGQMVEVGLDEGQAADVVAFVRAPVDEPPARLAAIAVLHFDGAELTRPVDDEVHVSMRVDTDKGRASFLMRWSNDRAASFGRDGKLLIDVDDNRYLIPRVDALPARERSAFTRIIYW